MEENEKIISLLEMYINGTIDIPTFRYKTKKVRKNLLKRIIINYLLEYHKANCVSSDVTTFEEQKQFNLYTYNFSKLLRRIYKLYPKWKITLLAYSFYYEKQENKKRIKEHAKEIYKRTNQ